MVLSFAVHSFTSFLPYGAYYFHLDQLCDSTLSRICLLYHWLPEALEGMERHNTTASERQ
jgi:hypothetical protein